MFASVSRKDKLSLSFAIATMILLIIDKFTALELNFYLALSLAVIAYIACAYEIVLGAFKTLVKRYRMSEEFLMVVATFGAFALGDFPEALAVMVFYRIGSLFEHYASGKAHQEISSLVKLKPTFVRVINEDGEETILKPRKVKIGSTIRVLAGEAVALDGYLLNEKAALNTAALTGESAPKIYKQGEEVPSGCINNSSVIELKVSRDSRNSSITRLLNLIEDAAANKSHPEALIRRFAVWYTPLVVASACVLALVPLVVPEANFSDWITRALVFLVVSCPCALVLSVPLSFFGGLGALSKVGIMVKGSIHIETLAKLKAIAFDKTGTVTAGKFTVKNIRVKAGDSLDLIKYAYALEAKSSHPLALGIVNYAKEQRVELLDINNIEEKAGLGVEGEYHGQTIAVGRYEYIVEKTVDKVEIYESAGTDIYVVKGGKYLGSIELYDDIKPYAEETFKALNKEHIATALITGDKASAANIIASKLGISTVFSKQLPENKLENFAKFKQEHEIAAFVGDGINDAPVLSASDLGIAMGQFGSASAVEASDVVIMQDDLRKIPIAVALAKKTYALAIQNMYFVILVKVLILALGALGFANIWLAIFGDVGVLVLSVINAMRSLTFTKGLNT
jgi:Cd2+/Zn2+-exporting ATPase